MNNFLFDIFQKQKKNMDEKKNGNTMTKIVSVIIAVVLWTYVIGEVNPEIVSEIKNVEVKLVNLENIEQSGLVVMGQDYYSVNIKVKGRRSDVVNITSADINAIADIRGFGEGENSIPVELNLPSNLEVESINPVQIKVTLDKVVRRSKPVVVEYTGKAAEGYIHGTPVLSQSEIMVSGPETYVKSVEEIVLKVDLNDSDEDIQRNASIQIVDSEGNEVLGVTTEETYISVSVPIFRVKSVPVDVEIVGTPAEGYELVNAVILPSKVEIMGREEIVDTVDKLEAEVLSLEGIYSSQDIPLTVNLPEGIQLVTPSRAPKVRVTVEKIISTEFEYNLDEIEIEGLDDHQTAELVSDEPIKFTVNDIGSVIETLTKDDINVSLNLDGLKEGEHSVVINWLSEKELKSVNVNPDTVDVLITKKEQ